ncbi:MAG: SDR family oxidoreductase [Microbacteriaceae bacterium]
MNIAYDPSLLAGKNALVTGAAGGIGAAVARHFVAAGARVLLTDLRDDVRKVSEQMGAAGAIVMDVTDQDQVAQGVSKAVDILGRVDILVNAHGKLTESRLAEMPLDMWNEMMAIDLTSLFLMCRAVLPGMLEHRSGRIINITSQLGLKGAVGMAHYSAAKAGVIAMTKSLALEVSSQGVLVNAVAPGPIETPLLAAISESWKADKSKELPLGRFGTVDEVAPTVVLLASDPGGNLYVGQTLGPNSGDVMP